MRPLHGDAEIYVARAPPSGPEKDIILVALLEVAVYLFDFAGNFGIFQRGEILRAHIDYFADVFRKPVSECLRRADENPGVGEVDCR